MKKLKFLSLMVLAASTCFVGCKEQPVGVTLNEAPTDTTYTLATPEAAQAKMYYVEEFTGVRCPNCPDGAIQLHNMDVASGGILVINSIHAGTLTNPQTGESTQDFRTTDGTNLLNGVYGGDVSKPCASFDRLPLGASGVLFGYRNQWDGMFSSAQSENATVPVNITITPSEIDSTFYVKVRTSFVQSMSGSLAMSVFLVEDSIREAQIDPYLPDTVFNHVFRKSLTSPIGDALLSAYDTKAPGLTYEAVYSFKVDRTDDKEKFWNLNHIKIIAIVHDPVSGTSKKVYQAAEIPLL